MNFTPTDDELLTDYKDLFHYIKHLKPDYLAHLEKWESILEVGVARGDGILALRKKFPNAKITGIDLPIPDPDHNVDLKETTGLMEYLSAKYIPVASPPAYAWEERYDFCIIDISTKAKVIIPSLDYWRNYINKNGLMVVSCPISHEKKRAQRELVVKFLKEKEIDYLAKNQFLFFFF